MTRISLTGALTLAFLVAGCEAKRTDAGNETASTAPAEPGTPAPAAVYSGSGTVSAVNGDQVSIAHGPIAGIGWPAMTMTFTAPAGMAAAVRPGSKVDFSFRKDGGSYVLTFIKPR